MLAATHSLEAVSNFPARCKKESASVTRRLFFEARQGHRGHMSESARSLEAGSSFLTHKKARQARSGHRGHVLAANAFPRSRKQFPHP
ncbi:MAG: hypothetical protein FWF77_03975 [Defluviitaleaceae bacterium]|nr:hypothetical protein [Defluviitaleaceae bacterium]